MLDSNHLRSTCRAVRPLDGWSTQRDSRQKTSSQRRDASTANHRRDIVANFADYCPRDHDGNNLWKHQGYELGSTGDGRRTLCCLKVEWDVISVGIIDHLKEASIKAAHQYRSLAKDPQRQHGIVSNLPCIKKKGYPYQAGAYQEIDDLRRSPWLRKAAPLEREDQAAYGSDEQAHANRVEMSQLSYQW
ncbi:MAG: hypothetical protein LQ345_001226 [Seirophora villosa]|nr:MAG: hypothetical protein LQ345_001226 [Seirophora villosa]